MVNSPNLMNLAIMTTVVGMGVVFVALLLLSIYMSFFKRFIANLESRHARKSAPPKKATTAAPKIAKNLTVKVADPKEEAAAAAIATGLYLKGVRPASVPEALAASIGVGLHLQGVAPSAGAEIAVAIATALGLHRKRQLSALAAPGVGGAGWGVAGRLDAHAGRMQMQSVQRQASVLTKPGSVPSAPRARARRRGGKTR